MSNNLDKSASDLSIDSNDAGTPWSVETGSALSVVSSANSAALEVTKGWSFFGDKSYVDYFLNKQNIKVSVDYTDTYDPDILATVFIPRSWAESYYIFFRDNSYIPAMIVLVLGIAYVILENVIGRDHIISHIVQDLAVLGALSYIPLMHKDICWSLLFSFDVAYVVGNIFIYNCISTFLFIRGGKQPALVVIRHILEFFVMSFMSFLDAMPYTIFSPCTKRVLYAFSAVFFGYWAVLWSTTPFPSEYEFSLHEKKWLITDICASVYWSFVFFTWKMCFCAFYYPESFVQLKQRVQQQDWSTSTTF